MNHRDVNINPSTREGSIDLGAIADVSGVTFLADGKTGVYVAQGSNRVRSFDGGAAPQSLCATSEALYIQNYADRSVTVIDLKPYYQSGTTDLPVTHLATVDPENDVLTAQQLKGLRLFYRARQPDLSLDGFFSCASCHDGQTWDFTQLGEGLPNTTELTLKGIPGYGHFNWAGNMDELTDVELKLEKLYGTQGLIPGINFNNRSGLDVATGGRSDDLDALAAYVASLKLYSRMSYYCLWRDLECEAELRKAKTDFGHIYNCAGCHQGEYHLAGSKPDDIFQDTLSHDVGTITIASGQNAANPLTAIRTPPLAGLWHSAPYLHDGSAQTLEEVFDTGFHANIGLEGEVKRRLIKYLYHLNAWDTADGNFVSDNPNL